MPPVEARRNAASRARAYLRAVLSIWGLGGELAETAELIVSELVANAAEASVDEHDQFRDGQVLLVWVRLHLDGKRLKAEVWDQAPGAPVPKDADDEAECGRGLAIVVGLADDWGWHPAKDQPGKCVWSELATATAPA